MKSEAQILQERKAWARGKLTVAWMKISKAAEDLDVLEAELGEAMAIAKEWGVNCRTVVEEVEASR